ncbi:MAG: LacI family transcriptional regulator [Treponemataceae bacterium]|nr:LacI family transcriptional regulator [Treponemataceae bacterium]
MKVTIKELAERAGVSKTAVSFAFNNPSRISKETYNRIMAIAEEIGYFPDPVARILATKTTQTVGMLFPQPVAEILTNPYIAEIIRGAGAVCDSKGYSLALLSPLKGIINHTIQSAAVDGMIILGVDKNSEVHSSFRQRNMPYVTIDAGKADGFVNVGVDDGLLSEHLMDNLLDNGHRHITVCPLNPISSELDETAGDLEHSTTSDVRRQGILRSIEKHGLKENQTVFLNYIIIGTNLEESCEKAKTFLQSEHQSTAVFCMADIQALGFYRAARDLGISIPDGLSVVSFDDMPMMDVLTPAVTTAHQSGYEKGYTAASLLFNQLEGSAAESVVLESHVVERGSVTRPSR